LGGTTDHLPQRASGVFWGELWGLAGFSTQLADTALHHVKHGTDDYVLCMLMRHDPFDALSNPILLEIRDSSYAGTVSQRTYLDWVAELRADARKPREHWTGYAGIWSPLGENKVLGSHIDLGCGVSRKMGRFDVGILLAGRFLGARDEYNIGHGGEIVGTDHFTGVYFGPELGLETVCIGRYALDLLLGGGLDSFEAYSNDDDFEWISSWAFSVGFRHRVFVGASRSRYLGLQARHYFVDFDSQGGSDLSGNTLSVSVTFGGWHKPRGEETLERLNETEP
jgi:hypothetical protein